VRSKSYRKSSCFLKKLKKTINTAIIRAKRITFFTISDAQLFGYTKGQNRDFHVFEVKNGIFGQKVF
jgi:hypothetical protein